MAVMVDVVIPVRNEEKLISRTLQSIHDQIVSGEYIFNICVIANACTDNTRMVAEKTVARLQSEKHILNIRYEVLERSVPGKNAALNFALNRTTADYFIYLDGDVSVSRNCLSAVADKLHNTGCIVAGPLYRNIIAEDTDDLLAKFYKIDDVLFEASRPREPIGAMIGFKTSLLKEIPLNALAENMYLTLLSASRHGVASVSIIEDAEVYQIAPKSMPDYVAREKRIAAAYKSMLSNYPEFESHYRILYGRYPSSYDLINYLIKPLLSNGTINQEDLGHWFETQEDIKNNSVIEDHLRPDGTWHPITSTKSI